jgi:outer membrane immunogenic protein
MKFRSYLLASIGVSLSTAALAADLPTRKEAPPPVPYVAPFTWTGFYIGGYAGGSFGSVDWSSPLFSGGTVTSGGFDIGGLAGFNYQFGATVVGVEAEFGAFLNGNDSLSVHGVVGNNAFTINDKFRDTGVGRLRGRVGYAVQPNTLLYIAGGWTFANTNESITGACTTCAVPNTFNFSQNRWLNGWNIGGGVEYALTSNWILRGEYIFDEFTKYNFNYGYAPASFADNRQIWLNVTTSRGAVEYKF